MRLRLKEITLFAFLGTAMFLSKLLLEFLPNIHLLGVLTVIYTALFGVKAIYPIATYVLLNGVYSGFAMWWLPYIYIWPVLWAVALAVPSSFSLKKKTVIYTIICTLHGLLFGTLYAPAQMIMFGLSFKGMIAWIIAGLPFDVIHAFGNLVFSLILFPFIPLFKKITQKIN